MRCGHRRLLFCGKGQSERKIPRIFESGPCRRYHTIIGITFSFPTVYTTVNTTMEPVTGIEPAPAEWKSAVLPLHHTGVVPVSPGCPAIRAKRALRLVTCTRTVNRHYKSSFCLAWLPTRAINSERLLALLVAGFRPPRPRLSGVPCFSKKPG